MNVLGDDPEEDEIVEGVVANVVKAAVVLVCPCTFANWPLSVHHYMPSNIK